MNIRTSKLRALAIFSLAVPLMAASSSADDKGVILKMEPGPDVIIFKLSEAELEFHKRRAIEGNATSGQCLAMHFSFLDSRNPETVYWITIAAENGDPIAMQMLSIRLEADGNPRDSSRAKFWKERAAFISANVKAQCRPAESQENAAPDDKRL